MNTPTPSTTVPGGPSHGAYLARGNHQLGFPRGQTALLVIDPVNDFLSEGGAAWELTKNTVKMHNVVENLQRAIGAARAHKVPVLFGPMAYTEADYANDELQRRTGINRIMFERRMFLAGSWGADFHPDLQPLDSEIVLQPHKGTDVFETDLPEHLRALSVTHLVIAGMTANLCCESTGRRAAEAGYDVTFLSDAIGSESVPSYEAAVRLNYPLIGNAVLKVDEFIAALGSDTTSAVQPGDTVYGSDRMEIGSVARVVAADGGGGGYLVVSHGLIFAHDVHIPIEAVVRRIGTDVFINVPKLVVGKMPWDKPPSAPGQREKYGPAGDEIEHLYRSRSPSTPASQGPSGGSLR